MMTWKHRAAGLAGELPAGQVDSDADLTAGQMIFPERDAERCKRPVGTFHRNWRNQHRMN